MFGNLTFGSWADVLNDKTVLIVFAILVALIIVRPKRLRIRFKGRDRQFSIDASKGDDSPQPRPRKEKPPEVITDIPPSRKMLGPPKGQNTASEIPATE